MPAEWCVGIYILRLMPVVGRTLSGRKDEMVLSVGFAMYKENE